MTAQVSTYSLHFKLYLLHEALNINTTRNTKPTQNMK